MRNPPRGSNMSTNRPPSARKNRAVAIACMVTVLSSNALAFEIETNNPDVKARFDTQVRYSLGYRTADAPDNLTTGIGALNFNDGNRNFSSRSRPITNRVDLFSEGDFQYRNLGFRLSGAAWYDAAYQNGTSNTSGLATGAATGPYNPANTLNTGTPGQFSDETKKLHGNKAELLDAFVFGTFDLGSSQLNARLGRHALLWGEGLFFGANGIAAGMAPIDIAKAQSSPNATIKEIIRPVSQLSGQLQINDQWSVGGYYQNKWESNRFAGAGSYYSGVDNFGPGGGVLYVPAQPFGPFGPTIQVPAVAGTERKAPDSGQGGVQVHFRPAGFDVDYGLYAIKYHSKTPVQYLLAGPPSAANPSGLTYDTVYAENIKAFGGSFNTTVGSFNLGGEASIRTNAPLARGLVVLATLPPAVAAAFNASNNPAYPVGRTAHINLSTIATLPSNLIALESSLAAEVAWNRVLSCQINCNNQDLNAERDALGFRMVYTPTYRQVFDGVDLSVPFGLSYSPKGKSGALGPLFIDGGGDVSLGLSANVREKYTVALNYTRYYGSANVQTASTGYFTFGQTLKGRDNITLSLRAAF